MSIVSLDNDNIIKTEKSFADYYRTTKNEVKEIFSFHPKEWISAFRRNSNYPFFVRGDIDGFIALFINNLSTLLAVVLSLQPILGDEIVYGKILPG